MAVDDIPCALEPDLWFSDDRADTRYAIRTCLTDCDPRARERCLLLALERNEFGVWGGTTQRTRQRMRNQLRQATQEADRWITCQSAA